MYDFGERPEKGLYLIDHMPKDERRQHAVLQRLSNLVDRDILRLRRVPRPVPEVHGLTA
jgi:hypothetical protein